MTDISPGNNPSRRLFLAAGSASAVFGALSSAVAAGEDDPIFAAIAEQRRCKALADEALAVCNRVNNELNDARDAIGVISFDGERYYSVSALNRAVVGKPALGESGWNAYLAAHNALVANEPAFTQAWDESGIDQAEDAFGERNKAYFDAEMAVLATRPTTFAGALALLAFLAEHLEGPHSDLGEDYPEPLLGAVRNALSALQREVA